MYHTCTVYFVSMPYEEDGQALPPDVRELVAVAAKPESTEMAADGAYQGGRAVWSERGVGEGLLCGMV